MLRWFDGTCQSSWLHAAWCANSVIALDSNRMLARQYCTAVLRAANLESKSASTRHCAQHITYSGFSGNPSLPVMITRSRPPPTEPGRKQWMNHGECTTFDKRFQCSRPELRHDRECDLKEQVNIYLLYCLRDGAEASAMVWPRPDWNYCACPVLLCLWAYNTDSWRLSCPPIQHRPWASVDCCSWWAWMGEGRWCWRCCCCYHFRILDCRRTACHSWARTRMARARKVACAIGPFEGSASLAGSTTTRTAGREEEMERQWATSKTCWRAVFQQLVLTGIAWWLTERCWLPDRGVHSGPVLLCRWKRCHSLVWNGKNRLCNQSTHRPTDSIYSLSFDYILAWLLIRLIRVVDVHLRKCVCEMVWRQRRCVPIHRSASTVRCRRAHSDKLAIQRGSTSSCCSLQSKIEHFWTNTTWWEELPVFTWARLCALSSTWKGQRCGRQLAPVNTMN